MKQITTNTMQETLQTRLQREFRNKILDIESEIRIKYTEKSADYMIAKMEDFISHTIAETIKALQDKN